MGNLHSSRKMQVNLTRKNVGQPDLFHFEDGSDMYMHIMAGSKTG